MKTRAAPIDAHGITETGEFTAIVATERRDAYGDELHIAGAELADYEANPVLLCEHDRNEPIGRMVSLERLADRLVARFRLASAGVSAAADRVRTLIAEGVLNAVSAGFLPIEAEPIPGAGQRFTRWSLAEVSVVTLPANPDALIVARAAPALLEEVPAMPDPVAEVPAVVPPSTPVAATPASAPQTVPVAPVARSLGQAVARSDLLTRAAKGGAVRDEFPFRRRALGTQAITGAGNTPVTVQPAFLGVDTSYVPLPRLIDYLADYPVSAGSVLYDVLTPTGNSAAVVPEGTAKPYQAFTATAVTQEIPTIAVLTKVTKQLLADLPAVQGLLDSTLTGLVLDRLDAEAFTHLTTAGAFTPWTGAVLGDNIFDGIARMVSALQQAGAKSIVVAVNPADALEMKLTKADTSGVYLVAPQIDATVVQVPAIPAGKALAFDTSAVALAMREQVAVEIGLDGDDWSKNMRTLLAETRALAISRRPALVLYGDLTTSTAATARTVKAK
ncbi:phage major capsid protein [Niveibacterium sp. SC-1]|uniref:phage major capsid protein n=1 Tax=Niveibacterium sp. SC-1 TaxID=3135646 RepID=UPI00311EC871